MQCLKKSHIITTVVGILHVTLRQPGVMIFSLTLTLYKLLRSIHMKGIKIISFISKHSVKAFFKCS